MLKAAICDDSTLATARLESLFCTIPNIVKEWDVFHTGLALLQYIRQRAVKYDVYLLDIEMPLLDGITLAKEIRKQDKNALFIFLTSYPNYVYDVFDTVAFHFQIKPISEEQIRRVLKKAVGYLDMLHKKCCFSYNKNYYSLDCEEILYFEKNNRKTYIYTADKRYETYLPKKEWLAQLDPTLFVSLGYSFVVNMEYIKEIIENEVILTNTVHLPISRRQRRKVKEQHSAYFSEVNTTASACCHNKPEKVCIQ